MNKPDLKKYLNRHFPLEGLMQTPDESGIPLISGKLKVSRVYHAKVILLKILPWVNLAAFGLSFIFDFTAEHFITLFGFNIHFTALIRIISVSGLIGYFTNWLAIRMLFKPVMKRPVWGQGLVPAQRDRIISQIAKGIYENILSEELIMKKVKESGIIKKVNNLVLNGTTSLLHDEAFRNEIRTFIQSYLQTTVEKEEVSVKISGAIHTGLEKSLDKGLKGFLFRAYKRFNPRDYKETVDGLVQNIPALASEAMDSLESEVKTLAEFLDSKKDVTEKILMRWIINILAKINIQELLKKQMDHFDENKLEKMIWNATNEQLIYIQNLGTALGMLGGLLIWKPEFVVPLYAGIFLILYLADILLYSSSKS